MSHVKQPTTARSVFVGRPLLVALAALTLIGVLTALVASVFEPLLTLGTAVIGGAITLLAIWLKAEIEVLKTKVAPVSNGFAAGTTERLDTLLVQVGRVLAVVDDHENRITDLEN